MEDHGKRRAGHARTRLHTPAHACTRPPRTQVGKKTVGTYRTEEEAIEAYAEENNVQLETEQFLILRQIQEEAEEFLVVGSGEPRIVTHARYRSRPHRRICARMRNPPIPAPSMLDTAWEAICAWVQDQSHLRILHCAF